ncbi:HD domain-containing protein [Alloacidobacterium dinghuense]|uniref:HD domain-containing protein n=1 Tax=Alloacidobacterium dinghuense TaxID=2763107 RepID=A0A7G8BPB0_9BACT|nr:HD domain-containing protein [Alloacidobacterium dinghuense]QNI34380.1 HD domain-containing protein [Alloacidobacterium dinghuense]
MLATFRTGIEKFIQSHAKPVEKYGHQPRLYALTRHIGADLKYDDDVVFAAAWLHDLGVFVGHRPEDPAELASWDHVRYACDCAPQILQDTGFPAEKIPAVLAAISEHQPQDSPTSIDATILRDADILEQLGGIGALRTIAKVGRDTRFSTFTDAVKTLRKNLEALPGQIRLENTKRLAEPRIAALRNFLDAVESESAGALF